MKLSEKISVAKTLIAKMYLDQEDTRPWAVAYSGGKDSTTVLGLLVNVLSLIPKKELKRMIHVVMSDTEMENPLVKDHMHTQANLIRKHVEKEKLPLTVTIVSRDVDHSYFVKTLGKGYFLPQSNGKGRWCTDSLKIKPQDKHLKALDPSYILTGVRKAESSQRSASIDKWSISEYIGNHVSLRDRNTFNPIVNWTIEDVWRYLEAEGLEWGSTLSVRQIYRDATGECGFTNPEEVGKKSVEVCGARHGCWNCPVILKDRSTEKMSEKHEWLEPLTEWRMTQLKVYGTYNMNKKAFKELNDKIKSVTKSGYRRNGKQMETGQGCLTVKARQFLLNELLETESLVNRMRKMSNLEPIKLISSEEIHLIKAQWTEDEEKRPYLIGKNLDDIMELIQ